MLLLGFEHCFCLVFAATLLADIQPIVTVGISSAEGLAVDWVTKHVYWVESDLNQIEITDFSGKFRATLLSEDIDKPRALVLDPSKG